MSVQAPAPDLPDVGREPRAWSQVPRPVPRALSEVGPALQLLAFAVALATPLIRNAVLPGRTWELAAEVAGAVLVASILLAVLSDRWWPVRLGVMAAAGAALLPHQGAFIALVTAVGLLLADWAIRRRRPLPFIPAPPPSAAAPATVLALVAAFQARHPERSLAVLIPLGLGFLVTAGAIWGGPLHRGLERAGAWLGRAVATVFTRVAFTILGLGIVVVPWGFQRILRIDPLAPPQPLPPGSGWIDRVRRDVQAADPWTREPIRREVSTWLRIRQALPAFILVAAGVFGYRALSSADAPQRFSNSAAEALGVDPSDEFGPIPAARAGDEDWYYEWEQDMRWITDDRVSWNMLDQYRFEDVATRYINVQDGHRVSWSPPESSRPRLTVWIYGGSTTFGFDQRDEHTIASELARVAHDHGIDLDVVNRGVNAQMHWMEANRFAWDLTTEDEKPDLVIFYDGFNELWGARQLDSLGFGDRREPLDPMTADLAEQLQEEAGKAPAPPPESKVTQKEVAPTNDPVVIGDLAGRRYEQARKMSKATAAAYDIPVRYFWQPNRFTRPENPEENRADPGSELRNRIMHEKAATWIGSDVTDLRDVFDDVDRPLYTDDAHHNEYGAHLVAEAMFASLQPELEQLEP